MDNVKTQVEGCDMLLISNGGTLVKNRGVKVGRVDAK